MITITMITITTDMITPMITITTGTATD
jgi:hypothetical protein